MTTPPSLPVVDISGFLHGDEQQRLAVAREWDAAFSSVGLATIVGHGVPDDAIEALYGSASAFFGASRDEKMRYCLNQGYGRGGFVPQGVEAVARSTGTETAPPDLVENFVFSHGGDPKLESVPVPTEPASFQPAVAAYWSQMDALLRTLMRLSAVALSLPAEHFEPCLESPKCNLRLAYYASLDTDAAAAGSIRYGAHTDYTGFTILRQDPRVGGLEAQTVDGAWHAVPPRPGGLVVNAGDLIQVWTNDRWRSPPHRVVNPPPELARQGRLSLVFFTGPTDETTIEALPGTHGPDNPKRYEPVSAREHLLRKLGLSNT